MEKRAHRSLTGNGAARSDAELAALARGGDNRAFAAELLASESLLRQRVEDGTVDEEQIDDIAAEFGVSSLAIRHQVENHAIAAIVPLYPAPAEGTASEPVAGVPSRL